MLFCTVIDVQHQKKDKMDCGLIEILGTTLRHLGKGLLFVLKFLARSVTLGLTLCLEGYFCHALCGRYLELELGEDRGSG